MEHKVLIVFGVSDLTGASRMGFYFAEGFRRRGMTVRAVSPPKMEAGFGGAENYASVNDELERVGIPVDVVVGIDKLAAVGAVFQLKRIIREHGITLVVSIHQNSLKYAAVASRLAGVRHVSSRQGPIVMYGSALVQSLKGGIFALCLRRGTDLCICTNEKDEVQLTRDWKYPKSTTRLLPNGIDVEVFDRSVQGRREEIRREFGIRDGELMMVNVGRLDPQKDQLTLLRAIREAQPLASPAKFVLVGNVTAIGASEAERYAEQLREFVRSNGLGDQVVFAGWRNDVPQVLGAADVYVHSAAWEGFPLVMCEAMAAKLPFIGTDCFGIPEGFEQGRHGWFVPRGDSTALAGVIRNVVGMTSEQRRFVGLEGRGLIERQYDARRIAERFVDLCLPASALAKG